MARETDAITRDIAETRREIDRDLQELSGTVQERLDIRQQIRRNLPMVLWSVAGAGLAFGLLFGGRSGRRRARRIGEIVEEETAIP